MCTAVTYKTKGFYFGRTLDFEYLFPSEVTITPRNFPLDFRFCEAISSHYAFVGMAYVRGGYPLYYDAVNEKGLSMAGLNFVGNAVYKKEQMGKTNIASFEFMPYILSKCSSVKDARALLEDMNITDTAFEAHLPPSQLHWIIADKDEAITVEAVKDGLMVYPNPMGVLTNNPPFPVHIENLSKQKHLTPKQKEPANNSDKGFSDFTRGTGAVGLPGDYTSQSRFLRAAFVKQNSKSDESEESSVNQFFHIMNSVSLPRGCCITEKGETDITNYSCCMSAQGLAYYYKTYESHSIRRVSMRKEDMNACNLVRYPLVREEQIINLN